MKKILIIRFSSIGDIVLTSPVIRCIKQQQSVKIHFLVKSEYSILLESNPHLEKVFYLKNNLNHIISDLKSENYDLIIDLHNNIRSSWIKFRLSAPSYALKKKTWQKYLLIYFNWNFLHNHVVDRYFEVVKNINIVNDHNGLEYFFNKKTNINFDVNQLFIAWSIGGSSNNKQLSKMQIIEVCSQLSYPVILLGGPSEKSLGDDIVKESNHEKMYNFCGSISLDQSAYLIKHSVLVLSNDTGLMHIAASFKKPIISFWGCTKPNLGFSPYMSVDGSKQLISPRSKQPCSKYGQSCRFRGGGCVKEISAQTILESVDDFLKKRG
tara:strand:+ start:8396 stop:9364 length:969 start_codon:yes stop_codon:yes gene_type:complete